MAVGPMSRETRRAMARRVASWPKRLTEVPRDEWPVGVVGAGRPPRIVFRSQDFIALVYDDTFDEQTYHRISVCRTTMKPDGHYEDQITWEELMRVKNECGYGDEWATEVYPPDNEVVNVANMRHLWIKPWSPLPYGWRKR